MPVNGFGYSRVRFGSRSARCGRERGIVPPPFHLGVVGPRPRAVSVSEAVLTGAAGRGMWRGFIM
jgi:hypothetical protein